MRIKDKRIFTGVMDMDSDLRDIAPNNYPYALNHSSTPDITNSTLGKNRKGTVDLFKRLPQGINKTVCSVYWVEKKANIYFIKNSNGNHCIRALYSDYSIVDILFSEPKLKFTVNFFADIIGDLLTWTDGVIEPRALLINKAIEYTKSYQWEFNNIGLSTTPSGESFNHFDSSLFNSQFYIGEKIYVQQNEGYLDENLNGYATVTYVANNTVSISKKITISTLGQTGRIFRYNKDKQYYKIDDVILNAIKQPPLFPPIPIYVKSLTDSNKENSRTIFTLTYFPNFVSQFTFQTKVILLNGLGGTQQLVWDYVPASQYQYLLNIKNFIENSNLVSGLKVNISENRLTIIAPDGVGDTWVDYSIKIETYSNNLSVPPLFNEAYNSSFISSFSKEVFFTGNQTISRTNNLRGNLFQFCYRYKYDDNAYSVWSPLSKVALPDGEQLSNGNFSHAYLNNYIKLSINSGSTEVKEIDIAIRQSGLIKFTKVQIIRKYDENGDFVLNENTLLNKYPANSFIDYYFNNSEYGVVLDDAEVTRLFDYVPLTAKCQSILNENVLVYANIKEGQDSIKTDVELNSNIKSIELTKIFYTSSKTNVFTETRNFRWGSSGFNQTNFSKTEAVIKLDFSWINPLIDFGKIINIKITNQYPISGSNPSTWVMGYTFHIVSYAINSNDSVENIIENLLQQINSLPLTSDPLTQYNWNTLNVMGTAPTSVDPHIYWKTRAMRYNMTSIANNISDPFNFTTKDLGFLYVYTPLILLSTPNTYYEFFVDNGVSKSKSFKLGAYHKLGMVYYDEAGNRCSDTNSIGNIYVPNLCELSQYQNKLITGIPYATISVKVNHKPPLWAKTWQFVYAGQSIDFKICFSLISIEINTTVPTKTLKLKLGTELMRINFTDTKDVILDYSFQKGDRIRFLYHKNNLGSVDYYNHAQLYDFEIKSVSATGSYIIIENFFGDDSWIPAWANDVVEIYSPLKQSNTQSEIFYEIGDCYNVLNPYTSNRLHGASTNVLAQTNEKYGEYEISSGDVYSLLRFSPASTLVSFVCQSPHYSDYYISNTTDLGRPILDIWNAKQLSLSTMIRVGGKYLQNTKTNNMFRFINSDYRNSAESFGGINRIVQRGQTLKIFQDKLVDSYYIGVTSLVDMSGKTSLEKSSEILGNRRTTEYDFGCIHPDSIQKSDNYIFYYDFNNGLAVADSEGGGNSISDNLMSTHFKKMKEILLSSHSFEVLSGYNEQDKEYILTFNWKILTSSPREEFETFNNFSETIVFSQKGKGWTTFLMHYKGENPAEMYGKLNDKYIIFISAQPFIGEQNELRNVNFGVQQKHIINVVSNVNKEKVKVFDYLEIHTNNNKISPESIIKNWKSDSIVIPPSSMYPLGMFSKLYPTQLISKEGFVSSNFNKNINTNKSGTEKYKLINGDELRGEVINIQLENSSSDNVEIYSAIVTSTNSEKSL